jgi:3-oxoacyl-[acyl-carrier protein] reductase
LDTQLLKGESAIITGAAKGIGRAVAELLAREGAQVLLTDIDDKSGSAVARMISEAGGTAAFLSGDLNDPLLPQQIFDLGLRQFGRLSIFVHCASPYHQNEDIFSLTEDALDGMLNVNIKAAVRFARLLAQHMKAARIKGRMLFISSLHASTPRGVLHYSAAKAGLTMLTKELAKAFAPDGIRVNALAPGIVPVTSFAGEHLWARAVPMGRLGRPEEIAGTALALLVDRFSGYLTGTTVVVDGGLSLHNWLPIPSE